MGQELIKLKQIEPITANDIPIEVRDKHYTYVAEGAILECTINHNMGKNPSVSITDIDKTKSMYGRIQYIDLNTLKITFSNYVNCIVELN